MNDLRYCPLCGSEAKLIIDEHIESDTTQTHRIACTDFINCGCSLSMQISPYHNDYANDVKRLKKQWNKRAVLSGTDTKAEWVKKQENLDGTIIYECSNCEHEIELTASPYHYDVYYCEACGADMGLDDE